ncbi:unnamed protein product [Mucor hiemalis]
MVLYASISKSVLLVSNILFSIVSAAPFTETASSALYSAPHNVAHNLSSIPPIILSRTQPVTNPENRGNLNAEATSTDKNKKWFSEHGGNLTSIEKRATNAVAGMTLVLPANAPPEALTSSSDPVVSATTSQINTFKLFAGVASTAYCSTVIPASGWSCTNCKIYVPDGEVIVTFDTPKYDIAGFILRSDSQKTIYLVFRGSSSLENWVVNLSYGKTSYTPVSGTQVHKGFYNGYAEAATYFFTQLQVQHVAYPSYTIAVTGHSLGGAQALLAGMDLYQRISTLNTSNLKIYTVGCPRVGDSNFAYYVEGTGITVSRSIHNRDIVPHLPPESSGFLHPGVETWEKSDTDIEICTNDIESDSCSDSIVPFTSISDHKIYYGIQEGTCV